jgi:hypothetical protein
VVTPAGFSQELARSSARRRDGSTRQRACVRHSVREIKGMRGWHGWFIPSVSVVRYEDREDRKRSRREHSTHTVLGLAM